jgi:hypothetical protein
MAQKSRMPGDPAHKGGFSEKCFTKPMKILNFLGLLGKKVGQSKMDFFKMWIPQ